MIYGSKNSLFKESLQFKDLICQLVNSYCVECDQSIFTSAIWYAGPVKGWAHLEQIISFNAHINILIYLQLHRELKCWIFR